jgi:hypothetical protein
MVLIIDFFIIKYFYSSKKKTVHFIPVGKITLEKNRLPGCSILLQGARVKRF